MLYAVLVLSAQEKIRTLSPGGGGGDNAVFCVRPFCTSLFSFKISAQEEIRTLSRGWGVGVVGGNAVFCVCTFCTSLF